MERRRRRRRALVALGITSALVAGTAYGTWRYIEQNEFLLNERCEVTVGEQTLELTPDRAHHAALIAAAAVNRQLPPEAAAHGIGMSMQEADLQVREADASQDHKALFARGNPSWSDGPDAQVAETSVEGFFDVLEQSWQAGQEAEGSEDAEDAEAPQHWTAQLELDEAAAVLERPHNPEFYPQHTTVARAFASPLAGQQPVDMTCRISQLEVPGPDPDGVVDQLASSLPNALGISFTEPDEDADQEEVDAFEPEPILDGVIESTGQGEDAVLRIQAPEADGTYDYQWMLAHWAVAVAREYGIQTVETGAYSWDRDSGQWNRTSESSGAEGAADAGAGAEVVLGFSSDP